jgi:hypothetical protein
MIAETHLSRDGETLTVRLPMTLQPRGSRKRIIGPDGEPVTTAPVIAGLESPVVRALARAWRWKRMLEGGGYGSVGDLAAAEKVNHSYLCRMLRLALLEPEVVEVIVAGGAEAG